MASFVLSYLLRLCLIISDPGLGFTLLAIGYIILDRQKFFIASLMHAFNIAFNAQLKSLWQIPLDPSLGKIWWAFPSGHAQHCVFIWIVLVLLANSYGYNLKFSFIIAALIILGTCYGLVFFRYHSVEDVVWSVPFALISATLYICLSALIKTKKQQLMTGAILSLLQLISLLMMPQLQCDETLTCSYWWLWFFVGFSMSITLCNSYTKHQNSSSRFFCIPFLLACGIFSFLNIFKTWQIELVLGAAYGIILCVFPVFAKRLVSVSYKNRSTRRGCT